MTKDPEFEENEDRREIPFGGNLPVKSRGTEGRNRSRNRMCVTPRHVAVFHFNTPKLLLF